MKEKVCFMISIILICITTVSVAFNMDMNLDKTKDINLNDELILTLQLNEKIVGASFKINYDTENLKLIESESKNLFVSENNEKIACIYFDLMKEGTDILKIKFEVIGNIENNYLNFQLEEAKFISLSDEITFSQEQIDGISKTIKIEKVTKKEHNAPRF